ncbi:MAG: hypothetical protein IKX59_10745 [Bacteroidales bacterium]|nr:hypothetical protein [Bacteroidales bacterium]
MNIVRHAIAMALTGLLFLSSSSALLAQGRSIPVSSEVKAEEQKELPVELPEGQKYRYRLFNGINVSVDILDPVLHLFTFEHASYEAQLMADFHHRFFPMVSFGMGLADETSDNGLEFGTGAKQEFTFKSDLAPFGKVGFAYNFDYNSTRPNDLYLVFLRYGLAYNKADITNLYYADELWGSLGPISICGQEYTTQWVELGGMIKVQIIKHISLGWDLYLKVKLSQSGTDYGSPFFVPGYGPNKSHVGFSFRLYYDIF